MTETEKSAEKLRATEEFILAYDEWFEEQSIIEEQFAYNKLLAARDKLKKLEEA